MRAVLCGRGNVRAAMPRECLSQKVDCVGRVRAREMSRFPDASFFPVRVYGEFLGARNTPLGRGTLPPGKGGPKFA